MKSKDLFHFSEVEFQEQILNTAAFNMFIRFKFVNLSVLGNINLLLYLIATLFVSAK